MRRADILDRHREELVPRVAVQADRRLVDSEEPQARGIEDPHRLRVRLEQGSVPLDGRLERLLGRPLVRDVADDHDDLLVQEWQDARLELLLPRGDVEGVFHRAEGPGLEDPAHRLPEGRRDLLRQDLEDLPAQERIRRHVEVREPAGVVAEDRPVGAEPEVQVRHRAEDRHRERGESARMELGRQADRVSGIHRRWTTAEGHRSLDRVGVRRTAASGLGRRWVGRRCRPGGLPARSCRGSGVRGRPAR